MIRVRKLVLPSKLQCGRLPRPPHLKVAQPVGNQRACDRSWKIPQQMTVKWRHAINGKQVKDETGKGMPSRSDAGPRYRLHKRVDDQTATLFTIVWLEIAGIKRKNG